MHVIGGSAKGTLESRTYQGWLEHRMWTENRPRLSAEVSSGRLAQGEIELISLIPEYQPHQQCITIEFGSPQPERPGSPLLSRGKSIGHALRHN